MKQLMPSKWPDISKMKISKNLNFKKMKVDETKDSKVISYAGDDELFFILMRRLWRKIKFSILTQMLVDMVLVDQNHNGLSDKTIILKLVNSNIIIIFKKVKKFENSNME